METELSRKLIDRLYAADTFAGFLASLEMRYPVGFFSHALEPIFLPASFAGFSLAEHTPYDPAAADCTSVYSVTHDFAAQDLILDRCYAGSVLYGAPVTEIKEDAAEIEKALRLALSLFAAEHGASETDLDAFLSNMEETSKDLFCIYFDVSAASRISGKLRCELARFAKPLFSCRCGDGIAFLLDEDISSSEELLSLLERFACRAGCSGPFAMAHLAIGCAEKAMRAAALSVKGETPKQFRDVRWASLCGEAFPVLEEQGYRVEDFLHGGLLRLIQNDQENATDYFPSLYAYLSHGKSLRIAAEKLNLHRNTLDYRIRRIRELFDLDLEDQNACFELLFSCRLYLSFLKGGCI